MKITDEGFYRTAGGEWEIEKDPTAELPYTFDFTDWLLGVETLATALIDISGSATMQVLEGPTIIDGKKVQTKIGGGTARDRARVTCTITTTGTLVDQRSFFVRVRDR